MRELKAEKIRDMTEEEIETRIRELHEELFNLRFRNAMRQLQNPVLIRERRRDIARMRTILVEHRKGVRKLSGHGDAAQPVAAAPKPAKAVKEPKRETTERKRAPKEAKKAAKEPKK
jgi:large subunit ribosomal protein L29